MPTISESITQIYTGYFNRAPDPAGLNYWVGHANGGMSLAAIASSFSVQPEATALYSFLANPATGAPATFLNSVYLNLFNRPIDAAGSAYWTAQLANPAISVGRVIIDIISGAFGPQGSPDDAALINNKTVVGQYFVSELQRLNLDFGLDAAKNVYTGVTKDVASLTTALTALNNTLNAMITNMLGSTFNLTSGTDNLTGTSGNDVFNAIVDSDVGSGQTLTAGDTVNGGGGRDVLNILFNTASTVAFPNANISNVEVINLRNISGKTLTFDSALVVGDVVVNVSPSSNEYNIINLPAGASVGVIGDGRAASPILNIGYANARETGTVTLSDLSDSVFNGRISFIGSPVSVVVNSITGFNEIFDLFVASATQILTINATTPLNIRYGINTAVVHGAELGTIIVTGSAINPDADTPAVHIGDSRASVVDASAMTAGGIEVHLNSEYGTVTSVKGGQGADIIDASKGNDTFQGGGGADFFEFGGKSTDPSVPVNFGGYDTITDFTVGVDYLGLSDDSLLVDSQQQLAVQAAVSTLVSGSTSAQIAMIMAATNTTNHAVSVAVFGGDTYIYYEVLGIGVGQESNGQLIKLVGVIA